MSNNVFCHKFTDLKVEDFETASCRFVRLLHLQLHCHTQHPSFSALALSSVNILSPLGCAKNVMVLSVPHNGSLSQA